MKDAKRSYRTGLVQRLMRFAVGCLLLLTVFPTHVRAQGMPAPLQDHDGTVEVLHEDRDQGSRFVFFSENRQ